MVLSYYDKYSLTYYSYYEVIYLELFYHRDLYGNPENLI